MRQDGGGRPFGLAEVSGPSMVPTLRHGDQLLVRYGARVRAGDVAVMRHPLQQDLLIVKRAVERREGGWWVLGDNPFAEPDSRVFGVVPDELVLARVLWRYRPRRGRAAGGALSGAASALAWAAGALRPVPARRRRETADAHGGPGR